jgi:peptidoglycan DL-endopeptidase CwlO
MRPSRRALATTVLVAIPMFGFVAGPSGPSVLAPVLGVIAAAPAEAAAAAVETGPLSDPVVADSVAALSALQSNDTTRYRAAVGPLALEVAQRTSVDVAELERVWLATDSTRMTALLSALSQVGVSYRYANATPGKAFDCSGLVSWAWSQAGVPLPRSSKQIIRSVSLKMLDQVLPGDVFYYPGHISMAIGVGDAFVHAPYRGRPVEVRDMYDNRHGRIKIGSPV